MQFKIVSTKKANSHILAHTIRLKDLVIRKGKILEKEHIALLIRNNINQIYVAIIEKHDLSENLSVKLIAGWEINMRMVDGNLTYISNYLLMSLKLMICQVL